MLPAQRSARSVFLLLLLALLGLAQGPRLAWAENKRAKEAAGKVRTIKDLVYYEGAGADKIKHRLDLYLPSERTGFPVLFFVHGGSWRHDDKNGWFGLYSALGKFLAERGIGTVVINYRLSPSVKHPEHIKDVARAFAWTRKHIARYGGRADQIIVCGHSAGGHLVALLATDKRYLEAEGQHVRDLKGVIALSGVFDVPDKMLASVFGKDGEGRRQASPLRHVNRDSRGLPPFLVLYGDKDIVLCGKEQGHSFCKALRSCGTEVQEVEASDCTHPGTVLSVGIPESDVSRAVLRFIRKRTAHP
jgi:acetyl esterase/lipase